MISATFVWKATGVDRLNITIFGSGSYTCGDSSQPVDVRFVRA